MSFSIKLVVKSWLLNILLNNKEGKYKISMNSYIDVLDLGGIFIIIFTYYLYVKLPYANSMKKKLMRVSGFFFYNTLVSVMYGNYPCTYKYYI